MQKWISVFVLSLLQITTVRASEILKDFDSLGGNKDLAIKAKALEPELKMQIVQDRIVNRHKRWEITPTFANVMGGDAYVKTQTAGLGVFFHMTPRWSLSANYNYNFNQMSSEGQYVIDSFHRIANIDYAKTSYLGEIQWYPIYGKFNLLEAAIVHFDIYGLAGTGRVQLKEKSAPMYTAGAGIGFWLSQHLTTRLEFLYQTYNSERETGQKKMDLTLISLGMGYLL
jgi:outer membrane immunogenic protein